MMRNGVLAAPTLPASTISNGPTAKATRYDGSGFVSANRTSFIRLPISFSLTAGAFATGNEIARNAQRQLPWRLEAGLVEARKRAARRRRLELRHRVPGAALLERKDAARRVPALLCIETEDDVMGSGRERLRERKADELIVVADDARMRAVAVDGDARNRERRGIEPQHRLRVLERDVDRDVARCLVGTGDDRQRERVMRRPRTRRQAQRRRSDAFRRGLRERRNARGKNEPGDQRRASKRPHPASTSVVTFSTQRAVSFSCTAFCRSRASSAGKSTSSSG